MSSDVVVRIDEALKDTSIPRRVKAVLERVKADIASTRKDKDVSITTAVYELDEIVNDVNIPMHAKTIIWEVISALESLKGS